MMMYQWRSSCCIWGSTIFCVSMFSKIVLVSFTRMFGYRFLMSSDAKVKCSSHGVSKILDQFFGVSYVEGVW